MTPNECQAARYLAADGYTAIEIADALRTDQSVVGRHLRGECNCPHLDEPQEIQAVDGEELRAARKAEGLTQGELASQVDSSYATISQVERGVVSGSDNLRYRINEWLDEHR